MHLLEQRGQILRLGDRDVVAQLEQALVVARPAPGRGDVRLAGGVEGALHGREQAQLLADDARALRVVLERRADARSAAV